MEKLGDRSPDRMAETTSPTATDGDRPFAAESRRYILRVCGPRVPARVIERAVADVAAVSGAGRRPPGPGTLGRIRAALRDAALTEAERSAGRLGTRLRRLAALHVRCASVPALLRQRASGELPAAEVVALYKRLDRCPFCAELTGRLDAAEWHLQQELGRAPRPDATAPPRASRRVAVDRPLARPLPAPPRSPASGSRVAVAAAAVVVLLGGGAFAVTRTAGSEADGPSVITPISRHALSRLPAIAPVAAGSALPGRDGLILGAPAPSLLATGPPPSAAVAVLGR